MSIESAIKNSGSQSLAAKEKAEQNKEAGEQQTQGQEANASEQTEQNQGGQEQQTEQTKQGEQSQSTQEQNTQGQENQNETTQQSENGSEGQLSERSILEHINSQYETNLSSLEDVKNLTSYKDKVSKYEEDLKTKDEALKSVNDPKSNFASEKLLKANEILKNNEGLSESVAMRLATTNPDELSDDDALTFKEIMDNPYYGSNEEMVKKLINNKYGMNASENDEELSDEQKQMMEMSKFQKQADAQKARESIKQMSNVEVPQQKDVEQEYKQKVEQFQPQADKLIDEELDKITLGKNGYEYKYDDKFKQWLKDQNYVSHRLAKEFDPNGSNQDYSKVTEEIQGMYLLMNKDKIMDDLEESVRTRMQDEFDQKVHNPKDNNRQEKEGPSDAETKNKEQQEKAIKAVKGLG